VPANGSMSSNHNNEDAIRKDIMKHLSQLDTSICDRCSRKMSPHAPDFDYQQRLAIRFRAGSDSVFGDGNLVETAPASIACSK
jgi:hypothetical protein